MGKLDRRRIAIDNNVINWKAFQGLSPTVQKDHKKRRDYQAILELFDLQGKNQIILVGVDQVDREVQQTPNEAKRVALIETWKLCEEKYCLTRFESLAKSKRGAKSKQESGINLQNGAWFVTDQDMKKIDEYVAFGTTSEEKTDLEVLATAAIARVDVFVTVDCRLLQNKRIKDFAKQKDDIQIYSPSEILDKLRGEKKE
jgi:hypothetical protein